jgi:hypothetical protein
LTDYRESAGWSQENIPPCPPALVFIGLLRFIETAELL